MLTFILLETSADDKKEPKLKTKKRPLSDNSAQDIVQAKAKAAKIREQGMKEYKEQLLKELETDRLRKVRIVAFLYICSLLLMLVFYFSDMSFEEIE